MFSKMSCGRIFHGEVVPECSIVSAYSSLSSLVKCHMEAHMLENSIDMEKVWEWRRIGYATLFPTLQQYGRIVIPQRVVQQFRSLTETSFLRRKPAAMA